MYYNIYVDGVSTEWIRANNDEDAIQKAERNWPGHIVSVSRIEGAEKEAGCN